MTYSKSLVIVQPYIPEYRVAFFEKLIPALSELGIRCTVAASQPGGRQKFRGDAVEPDWMVPIVQRRLSLAGRTVGLGGARKSWSSADGVIVGLLGSSIDTYWALAEARARNLKVGVWGHIKPYVQKGHPLDLALEKWQLRQADHVFAYTPGGARYALQAGVDREKITTVMNAIDTSSLNQAVSSVTNQEIEALQKTYNLSPGRTLAFWGGLDESKRIDFLAQALDELWQAAPDVKVLVGGAGSQAHLLNRSVERGQVHLLGVIDRKKQASIAQVARAILMPGRIGLIAVDALVLGLPIITTDWPYHSAEVEYLQEGDSLITTPDDVRAYSAAIQLLLSAPVKQKGVAPRKTYPTIENMVNNYLSGVVRMFDSEV